MDSDYLQLLDETLTELIDTIGQFPQDLINSIPFEESWSAGRVTVHVLKSIEGLPGLFSAASMPTERDPHHFEPELKKIFLDFNSKMKSPDFVLPGEGPFEKQELLDRLVAIRHAIQGKIREIDLSQTFTQFSFPGVGALTGFELLCFAYCHTTRHIRQIKNISDLVIKKSSANTATV